jgi:hypothetical protein
LVVLVVVSSPGSSSPPAHPSCSPAWKVIPASARSSPPAHLSPPQG